MNCPHCAVTATKKRAKKTKLGYTTFFCPQCRSLFNERTGTLFNYLEFPTDIVLLVVLWRLRYKLSLRDRAEMFLERGFVFTHETWEERFAPLIADQLRIKRRGRAGISWHVDETYIKVHGKWCSFENNFGTRWSGREKGQRIRRVHAKRHDHWLGWSRCGSSMGEREL